MKRYIGVKLINAQPMTRAAYNQLVPWTASQTDVLASDWTVV
jgi:hypothetical protein